MSMYEIVCIHTTTHEANDRTRRESERATEWEFSMQTACFSIHKHNTPSEFHTQREKKKCEKQSGPKSFAYNSRYYNNNNNRTAAELKYQIYLNVRRICCAMCYAFTSVARVIKHIIHLTRASTNGLRNQTKEWTNVHTYVRTNQTTWLLNQWCMRFIATIQICANIPEKKRKQKQFLFIRWRIFFINFNNVFLNVCHW